MTSTYKPTEAEIKDILDAHGKWLRDEDGGKRADLAGADLTGAVLTGADLTGADLAGADLTGADLTRADLTRAKYTQETLWPAGFDPEATGAVLV